MATRVIAAEEPTPVHDTAERRARGYTWETFRAGNFIGLRHGAKSERVLAPLAAQLAAALIAERPDLAAPSYRFAVSAWARAETLAMLLFATIEGTPDGRPAPKSILDQQRAAERRAAEERRNLGLDPSAAARLARDQAEAARSGFDLQAAIAKGKEVIDARSVERSRALHPARPGADLTPEEADNLERIEHAELLRRGLVESTIVEGES